MKGIKLNVAQGVRAVVGVSAVALAQVTFAATTSFDPSQITGSIDWSAVITGLSAVAVSAVGVYLAIRGIKYIIGAVKSI